MGWAKSLCKQLDRLGANDVEIDVIINDMKSDDYDHAIDVLEKYLRLMTDDVGAVGGTVLTKGYGGEGSNRMEHIYSAPNIQWSVGKGVVEVDHLHSTFLYRANIVDYNLELSPVAHREETIFTYEL